MNKDYEVSDIYDFIERLKNKRDKDIPKSTDFTQKGWICPVCGRGLSPSTRSCPCVSRPDTAMPKYTLTTC